MLSGVQLGKEKMMKREVVKKRPTRQELDQANDDSNESQAKKEETEFFTNQYWSNNQLNQSSIDDLLKSEGFDF